MQPIRVSRIRRLRELEIRHGRQFQIETVDAHLPLCSEVPFVELTRNVLNRLQGTPKVVNTAAALAMIQTHEFDAVILDGRELDNLAEFLCCGGPV
jgi:hypothetical protein